VFQEVIETVARSFPSKDKTILDGKVAEETLGVLLCAHEEGSLRILKTLAALVEK
jgi:hypothetical protein